MDNLTRSRRLVEALVAVRPEFKESKPWWFKPSETHVRINGKWRTEHWAPHPPDLLAPAHLADLFDVCRAAGMCSVYIGFEGRVSALFDKGDGKFAGAECAGDTLSHALMLAAEAALGLQGEEGNA